MEKEEAQRKSNHVNPVLYGKLANKSYESLCHLVIDSEGYTAVTVVALLYAYTYYAFVYLVMWPIRDQYPRFVIICLIIFHFFFTMTILSWLQAMFTNPGMIAHENISVDFFFFFFPCISSDSICCESAQSQTEEEMKKCKKCSLPKPERTHHCIYFCVNLFILRLIWLQVHIVIVV